MVCVRLERALEAEHSRISQEMNQGAGSSSLSETAAPVLTKEVALSSALPSEKCLTQCLCQAAQHHLAQALRYCHSTSDVRRRCALKYLWLPTRAVRKLSYHHPELAVRVTARLHALQHH